MATGKPPWSQQYPQEVHTFSSNLTKQSYLIIDFHKLISLSLFPSPSLCNLVLSSVFAQIFSFRFRLFSTLEQLEIIHPYLNICLLRQMTFCSNAFTSTYIMLLPVTFIIMTLFYSDCTCFK